MLSIELQVIYQLLFRFANCMRKNKTILSNNRTIISNESLVLQQSKDGGIFKIPVNIIRLDQKYTIIRISNPDRYPIDIIQILNIVAYTGKSGKKKLSLSLKY